MMLRLDRFDAAAFLRDHWQRRPLLIRQAWTDWHNPLEPDELAGLACEDGVESRLIIGAPGAWTVEHGPLAEERFARLGARDWTLLVQAVDHFVPEVAALIEPFRFIPDWRIDDVMVSYATDGGGVGPHFDRYDVFLVQGLGRRRWRVGPRCGEDAGLLPHDDLRLLARFEASEEWVLEPGDILYLPPGFAHDGVAIGDDCMTYSIGFRAPSRAELIGQWADEVIAGLDDDDRYADPGLRLQDNPGEIAPEALDRLHAMVTDALQDRAAFARWFGRHSSTPRYPETDWRPADPPSVDALRSAIAAGTVLERNAASRFAFIAEPADRVRLFVDGHSHDCTGALAAFATALCAARSLRPDPALAADAAALALIHALILQGSLTIAEA